MLNMNNIKRVLPLSCSIYLYDKRHKKNIKVNVYLGDKGNKFYIILKGSVSVLLPEERKVKMNISQYKKYLLQLYQ